MSDLRDAIKLILENNMAVDDTYVNLYWANGPMGYTEGDPTPYVVSQSCCEDKDEFYEVKLLPESPPKSHETD